MEEMELEPYRLFFGHLTKIVVLRVLLPVCLCRGGGRFEMKEDNLEQNVGMNFCLNLVKNIREKYKKERKIFFEACLRGI